MKTKTILLSTGIACAAGAVFAAGHEWVILAGVALRSFRAVSSSASRWRELWYLSLNWC